jgi:hypothetical protein
MARVIIRCVLSLSLHSRRGLTRPLEMVDPARNPGAPELDGRSRSPKATRTAEISAQAGIDHALPER